MCTRLLLNFLDSDYCQMSQLVGWHYKIATVRSFGPSVATYILTDDDGLGKL